MKMDGKWLASGLLQDLQTGVAARKTAIFPGSGLRRLLEKDGFKNISEAI